MNLKALLHDGVSLKILKVSHSSFVICMMGWGGHRSTKKRETQFILSQSNASTRLLITSKSPAAVYHPAQTLLCSPTLETHMQQLGTNSLQDAIYRSTLDPMK